MYLGMYVDLEAIQATDPQNPHMYNIPSTGYGYRSDPPNGPIGGIFFGSMYDTILGQDRKVVIATEIMRSMFLLPVRLSCEQQINGL